MSEPILRALMQLFALISDIGNPDEISSREKNVVRAFLARQLNSELVERFIRIFDDYLDLYINREAIKVGSEGQSVAALKTTRIKKICDNINRELRQKQKIYIIIQLIDFISYGKDITENELDFLMTVALSLNITENEYKNIRFFILGPISKIREKDKLLLINNCSKLEKSKIKHICNDKISGELIFLNITSTKTFIFRYTGDHDLFLDGQQVFSKQTYIFDNGSTIKGHGLKTLYYSEIFGHFNEQKPGTRISFSARDLVFKFSDSENGIQNFNFYEESGQLVGILGVSGTGKSTLLNILNGTIKPQSGEIRINGYDLNNPEEKSKLKGIIGFVPQDDFLIEELTVFQNLYYNARLCLDNYSPLRLKRLVNKLLNDLDLFEIRNLKVGSPLDKVISGGQRKRINIALELIREPSVLFVDEPTSGLSSIDSEVVINLLKEQTYKGKLVVINIHQPSSELFKLFDKIIILDKGGYQIYYGNPNAAIVYFKMLSQHANADEDQCSKCGNINTDQLLQIVEEKVIDEHGKLTQTRKVSPEEWYASFRKHNLIEKQPQQTDLKEKLPPSLYSIPNLWNQMLLFFRRDFLTKLENKQYLLISLLGAPLLAFLLGYFTKYIRTGVYLFSENVNLPAYLFMAVITSIFLGLMISSEEILKDRKILKRESFLNLSWFSYINSKVMIMFITSAVNTLSFIIVGNLILGIKGMTWAYWICLFTASCAANLLGLNISSAFRSVITIYILIPFIIIPQLLFSGVLVKYDKLHYSLGTNDKYVPLIGELMPARWSFEAIAVKQFKDNSFEKIFFRNDMEESRKNWYASFLIPCLERDAELCSVYIDSVQYNSDIKNNFLKLNRYLTKLSDLSGLSFPDYLKSSLNTAEFDHDKYEELTSYMGSLKKQFIKSLKRLSREYDSVITIIKQKQGNSWLINLRDQNDNKRLREIILDQTLGDKLIETDREIIQKYEPGFMEPLSKYGRAHFYAPYKLLGNLEVDTFRFNTGVLWLVSILLYLALRFKLLKRLIGWMEDIRITRTAEGKIKVVHDNQGRNLE
jgi:ABC-type multidrug transport system ATPase subunit